MRKYGVFAVAFAVAAAFAGQAFAMPTATAKFADCANDVSDGGTLVSKSTGTIVCATQDSRKSVGAIDFNQNPTGGDFYSLGLNGTLYFQIEPDFSGPGVIFEVTNPSNHKEAVDIYVSVDGADWGDPIARLTNDITSSGPSSKSFFVNGIFSYIGFVDVSKDEFGTGTSSTDGYDIASFSLTAVPMPATLPLMLTAFGGMAVVRRLRRRA